MTVRTGGTCTIADCDKPQFGKTWCSRHYAIWRKYGDPLHAVRQYVRQGSTCSADDCDAPPKTRGLCTKHLHLMRRYGTTEESFKRRFWEKVNKSGPVPDCNPSLGRCWVWTGYTAPRTGYGQYGGNQTGSSRLVHRIAYELCVAPVPEGKWLDHLCKVRNCVNPAHLEPVTPRENIRRGDQGAFWGYEPPAPAPAKSPEATICTAEPSCPKPVYKSGMCRPHYRKWLKDPEVPRPSSLSVDERFWSKVDKSGTCWRWIGTLNRGTGYGQMTIRVDGRPKTIQAHRYSFEQANGLIPEGLDVHHECHQRDCVRPEHLRAVTRSENLALRKSRR